MDCSHVVAVAATFVCWGAGPGPLVADEAVPSPPAVGLVGPPGDLPVELLHVAIDELIYLDATGRPPREPYVLESNQPFELIVRFRVIAPAGERTHGVAVIHFIEDRPDGRSVICQSTGARPERQEDGTCLVHARPGPIRRFGTLRVQIRGANYCLPEHSVALLPP